MQLKTKFLSEVSAPYDGSQLSPTFIYRHYGLLGSAMVAWVGPCQVAWEHMVDSADWRERKSIQGARMLHFVGEFFHHDLVAGILWTRWMSMTLQDWLGNTYAWKLTRDGDDLYDHEGKKLNISIATLAPQSVLIHFALNVSSQGAPVPICSLEDRGIAPETCADFMFKALTQEWEEVWQAYFKAKPSSS